MYISTKTFKQLSKLDVEIAGGKGASLGEMTQVGIPVPEGFVILSTEFDRFLEEAGLKAEIQAELEKVNTEEVHTLESSSKVIQALIKGRSFPEDLKNEILIEFEKLNSPFVAVRSSATSEDGSDAAWAGQLDSFLNTTKDTLLENIQKCWASLFTPRAISYRLKKKLRDESISVAVVIQKMVESEVSGVTFSVHPVTQDYNQIIIEAGFGLGEAVVSGQITPDSYILDKQDLSFIDIQIHEQRREFVKGGDGGTIWKDIPLEKSSQQKLSNEEIKTLANLIIRIEKHYGFPVDVEWAKNDGKFYIVQSRPITTLIGKVNPDENILKKRIERTVYSQVLHHDFPLIIAELTNEQETIKDLPWASEEFNFHPYCVFERKNDLLYYYYDINGVDWKINQAGLFDKEIMKEKVIQFYKLVEKTLLEKPALSKKEFLSFLDRLRDGWVWWDCMWWMIEYYDKHNLPMDDLIAVRKRTEHLAPGISETIRNSLRKLFPQKEEFIDVISLKEVESGILPSDDVLRKRLKNFVYTDATLYDSIDKVKNIFDIDIERIDVKDKIIFKGQAVVPGKVKCFVRRVETASDVRKFQQGEILVSSTTTPDFLPAMEKAGAILSEHGGAISHAAITSRELNKPCIVGIKGLTDSLKTGDYVEVDANTGVVRILKKAEENN